MKFLARYRAMEIVALLGAAVCLGAVGGMVLRVVSSQGFWDFNAFYSSASLAVRGLDFYTTYGSENLPYWYFPWLAWYFIPFAVVPYAVAKAVYVGLSLASLSLVVHTLGRLFNPRISVALQMFIVAMSLLMSMLLFIAGQMDFLLLGAVAAAVIFLHRDRPVAAGLMFPILLFKPHILAVFLPALLLRGGRAFRLSALGSVGVLSLAAFWFVPRWPVEMIRMLSSYGGRSDNYWNFITLPQLLGRQENWSGTANLPLTICMLAVGFLVAWRFRALPIAPFLALTLSASMLGAPRAYTYNLPILIPPMLWVSVNQPRWGTLLWLSAGIVALASNWSTGSYIIVIAVFVLVVLRARKTITAALEWQHV